MNVPTYFYCNSCSMYASEDRRSKKYTCCTGCEKRADEVRASRALKELEAAVKINAIPVLSKRCGIAAIMEKRALDDVIKDNWMND